MIKYVLVHWPEIQNYVEHPRFKECYSCNALENSGNDDDYQPAYMVPEGLYDEVMNPPFELPEEYKENFTVDFDRIKRGQKVLIEDVQKQELFIVEAETSWTGDSMPCILTGEYLPGINCYIVAVEKESIQS